jgi:transcriptional regulator with XRE-family HTH domain
MEKLLPIFAYNMKAYQDAASQHGYTATECAARIGMSRAQWSQLVNGRVSKPSVWTALRIAEVFGISVDALVTTDPNVRAEAIAKIESKFKRDTP